MIFDRVSSDISTITRKPTLVVSQTRHKPASSAFETSYKSYCGYKHHEKGGPLKILHSEVEIAD